MQRTSRWGALLGLWLLATVGSLFVLFVEVSDGRRLGPAFTVSAGVLFACVVAVVGYRLGVPRPSRPGARSWAVAVAVCGGLLLLLLGVVTMLALRGALRG